MTPADRLAGLVGTWQVARVLRGNGLRARFSGTATWAAEGPLLRCTEAGTLTRDGVSFAAMRETLWRAAPGEIHVLFGDGRPFHSVTPGPTAYARHDCAPDTYDLRYDFSAWPHWSCRWHVTGPRKGYRALTRYRRA